MTMFAKGEKIVDFQVAEKNNFIGVGWNRIGDLSWLTEDTREDMKEKFRISDPEANEREIGNWTGQLIRFVCDMEVDDIVILPIETNIEFTEAGNKYTYDEKAYLIGRIKSGYYFAGEKPEDKCLCQHRRDVEWQKSISEDKFREPLKSNASRGTVNNVSKYEELIESIISGKKIETKPIKIENKTDMIEENINIQKRLMVLSPQEFEELVSQVLSCKYGLKFVKTQDTADGGVDFVALSGRGHIKYRGQVKRVSRNISNSEILQLRGTLLEEEEGIFVTVSYFTPSALEEAEFSGKKRIYPINGREIAQFIMDVYNELPEKFKNILKINK